jgi:preprotein translocase subunit SecF
MIRFSKFIWLYFLISGIVLIPGILSLLRYGLVPSIDFAGGSLLEIQVSPSVNQGQLEASARDNGIEFSSVQKTGDSTFLLRTRKEQNTKLDPFFKDITIASVAPQLVRQETVGPVLGKELLAKAVVAAVIAVSVILLYVAYAFQNVKYGVAAIIALLHDLLVVLGCFSLLGHFWGIEVDTLFVTAFLTTMSFSVHDTIVVFDRIREYLRKRQSGTFEEITDKALTETMGRSLANSMTIIFMLLALVLMGGSSTRWFATALLIGTVSGTYSSDFIAVPILIMWQRWEDRRKIARTRK